MRQPHASSITSGIVAGGVVPGTFNKASRVTQSVDFFVPVTISGWDFNPLYAAAMGVEPSGFLQVIVTPYVP